MGIPALTINYVTTSATNATNKIGGWIKPLRGFVELNVDAYFDQDLLMGTTRALLRDDRGNSLLVEIRRLIGVMMPDN